MHHPVAVKVRRCLEDLPHEVADDGQGDRLSAGVEVLDKVVQVVIGYGWQAHHSSNHIQKRWRTP